jgi:hypothetical protein
MHDDLKRRLRAEVAAELGTRPPSDLTDVLRRGRGKRLIGTVSMVLLAAAVVGGGLWIGRTVSSPSDDGRNSIQPADDEASPSEQARCETPELDSPDGAGPRCLFDGEVGFYISGWYEHFESRIVSQAMGPSSHLQHERPWAGLLVMVDPAPLRSCSPAGATVASAEEFVDAVRGNPGLSSTDPVTEQIGGVEALRLDVAPVEGARTCRGVGVIIDQGALPPHVGVPVITGTHKDYFGSPLPHVVEADQRMRLYLVDLPGGRAQTLAIVIVAAEEDLNAAVELAKPILGTFEFYGMRQETN